MENELDSTASTPPSPVVARSRTEYQGRKTSSGQTKEVLFYFLTYVLLLANTDHLFLAYGQDYNDSLLIFIAAAGI